MEENSRKNNLHDKDTNLEETKKERDSLREKNNMMWAIITAGVLVVILILYLFLSSGDSHYDRGLQYIREKQYSEAMTEFQKVDPDEKEFRMAQSKINYINGLRAFNEGLKQESKVFLTRVEPTDEYYNEAQLLIDKVNTAGKESELEAMREALSKKDTVIIKEKIVEVPTEKVDAAEPNATDSPSKIYTIGIQRIVNNFQSSYESARTASIESKKDYARNMDSLYNEFIKWDNNSKETNVSAMELKRVTNSWMKKRIDFVNTLIAENSVTETPTLRPLREEGDKEYSLLMSLLRK